MLEIKSTVYNPGDIISLRLISGEEVIGRFVRLEIDSYVITKPMEIGVTPQGQVGMSQIMISVSPDEEFPIYKTAITTHCKTGKEMANGYREGTSDITVQLDKPGLLV